MAKKKVIVISAVAFLVVVAAGFLAFNYQQSQVLRGEPGKKVSSVDDITITDADIAAKIKLENAYGNSNITQEEALVGLLDQFLEQAVAKKFQLTATQQELIDLDNHAVQNSKAPDILQQIKTNISESAYQRLYLAPKITNKKLHLFYSTNKDFHKEARNAIEKARGFVQSGASFASAAQETGVVYSTSSVPLFFGDPGIPDAFQPYFSSTSSADALFPEDPVLKIVKTLSVGAIYQDILEDDYSYSLIRLISRQKQKDIYVIESLVSPKQSYDQWFMKQAGTVKMNIQDAALKQSIQSKYPGVWWLESI
ncbi:MAG: hypothetical protein AAB581_00250 [Patescibacteria group bacterium]